MGLERYLLHDFFTAAEFNGLEERLRNQRNFERHRRELTRSRLSQLEADLARVALLTRTLADLCLAKGLVTKEELAQHMLAADLADGAQDERLDPRTVMPGESKLAELEPLVPPPARRPRKRRE